VLKACAPGLAELCEPYPDMKSIPIYGVDFNGFELALSALSHTLSGKSILKEEWKLQIDSLSCA